MIKEREKELLAEISLKAIKNAWTHTRARESALRLGYKEAEESYYPMVRDTPLFQLVLKNEIDKTNKQIRADEKKRILEKLGEDFEYLIDFYSDSLSIRVIRKIGYVNGLIDCKRIVTGDFNEM